ncbi:MAG TPA: hypothetical protein VGZ52_03355, partial [Acidimicrobiales bacterium]|nr:hypothetical protein [Acidimicrobiales bacterium]
MISVLAHGFGGTNGLPLPRWLLAYCVGFTIVILFIVLRVVLLSPPRPKPSPRRELLGRFLVATRAIGLLIFAGVVIAAA